LNRVFTLPDEEATASKENPVKHITLTLISLLAALPAAARPCSNIPVSLTFSFSYVDPQTGAALSSAIFSDGTALNNAPYVDGQDGVSAQILCSDTDIVLNLASSRRTIGFDFTNMLWANSATPSFVTNATQNPFYSKANLTIRNVMYNYSQSLDYTFTTRLGSYMPAPDHNTYFPRMLNPFSEAFTAPPDPSVNTPVAAFDTSLVVIHHTANPESWIIYPDSALKGITATGADATRVLSLLQDAKKGFTNVGQFSMPFFIVVKRK
jgi:hypothetical protein